MINFSKFLITTSTTVLLSSTYSELLLPNSFLEIGYTTHLNSLIAILGTTFFASSSVVQPVFQFSDFTNLLTRELSTGTISFIYWLFFILTILFYFFILFFLLNSFFLKKNNYIFIVKMVRFLKIGIVPNLPFFFFTDIVLSFLFFFMTLYFLEFHFFFIFLFDLSSDTLVYTFNFLLSSFMFIFFLKFIKNTFVMGIFFSVVSLFSVSTRFFQLNYLSIVSANQTKSKINPFKLAYYFKYSVYSIVFILFFFSTFLIWLLRYIIQFIRLFVLYMIHMVFEQIIISSDYLFSVNNQISFFFFKSIFFIFFLFWGFLYLLVYLNLMFTLQTLIFFFFSEVFQSNFLFDLSAVVSSKLKLI